MSIWDSAFMIWRLTSEEQSGEEETQVWKGMPWDQSRTCSIWNFCEKNGFVINNVSMSKWWLSRKNRWLGKKKEDKLRTVSTRIWFMHPPPPTPTLNSKKVKEKGFQMLDNKKHRRLEKQQNEPFEYSRLLSSSSSG